MNDSLSPAAERRPAAVDHIHVPARNGYRRDVAVTGTTPRLPLPRDPYDHRAEKIRSLRTELMLRHEDQGQCNTVALLSPERTEGRSQLVAELAIAFSQLGRPTLLVDADLRHPVQHTLFGTDNRCGLTQAIAAGEAPRMLRFEQFPALSLLTAGTPPQNPVELLSARRFRDLMDSWRTAYDFVLLDSPPVSEYSDGLAIAAVARRVLVLSRADHSPYGETRDLLRRLAATQSQVVGAVVSRF